MFEVVSFLLCVWKLRIFLFEYGIIYYNFIIKACPLNFITLDFSSGI
jgi:hypothetical protein